MVCKKRGEGIVFKRSGVSKEGYQWYSTRDCNQFLKDKGGCRRSNRMEGASVVEGLVSEGGDEILGEMKALLRVFTFSHAGERKRRC